MMNIYVSKNCVLYYYCMCIFNFYSCPEKKQLLNDINSVVLSVVISFVPLLWLHHAVFYHGPINLYWQLPS